MDDFEAKYHEIDDFEAKSLKMDDLEAKWLKMSHLGMGWPDVSDLGQPERSKIECVRVKHAKSARFESPNVPK